MNNKIKWLVIGCLAGVVEIGWSDTNFPCTTPGEWHSMNIPKIAAFSCDIKIGSDVISTSCTDASPNAFNPAGCYDHNTSHSFNSYVTKQACAENFADYAGHNARKYYAFIMSCNNKDQWSSSVEGKLTCKTRTNPRTCLLSPANPLDMMSNWVLTMTDTNSGHALYQCPNNDSPTKESCSTCFTNAPK